MVVAFLYLASLQCGRIPGLGLGRQRVCSRGWWCAWAPFTIRSVLPPADAHLGQLQPPPHTPGNDTPPLPAASDCLVWGYESIRLLRRCRINSVVPFIFQSSQDQAEATFLLKTHSCLTSSPSLSCPLPPFQNWLPIM